MKKGYVVLVLFVIAAVLLSLAPQPALAHAPSSVSLSYNYSTQNLSVSISHSVSTPSTHYVQTVTLYKNSVQLTAYSYTSQPTTNSFTYYYNVTAVDGDSLSATADCNQGGSRSGSVSVVAPDTTDPTVMISSPSNATEVTTSTITISGTASDNKGLNKVQVKVNEGTWVDASGKTSWTYQATLVEGMNNITAKAIDTSDNEATAMIVVIYNATPPPDLTLPGIFIQSPSDGSIFDVENITISGASSDNEAVALVEVRLNSGEWSNATGTVTWTADVTLIEGNNTVEARATDTSDNTRTTSIRVEYSPAAPPDTTVPELTIQAPDNGSVVAMDEITVSGIASDDRGVAFIQARVNNGSWNMATGTTTWSIKLSLMEGNNTIEVWAEDDAGNNVTETVMVEYDPEEPPDTENPLVAITSPAEDEEFREADIMVIGTASDNSCPCRVEVSVDGGNWQLANGRETWSIEVQITPGTNVIEARAIDDSGNIGFDTVTVFYNDTPPADTTPPEVEITTVINVTLNDPDLTVAGTASDDRELDYVEVQLNNGSWVKATGTVNWTINLTLEEGANTVVARAVDKAGNTNTTNTGFFYELPYTPGTLDGVITEDEYRANSSFDDGNFMIYWDFEGNTLKMALKVKTTGWVSIGLDHSIKMEDSDMIIAWVDDMDRVFIIDAYSTGAEGPHPPDTVLGGLDDIMDFGGTEVDGWTTIEFTRVTNSTDTYDKDVFDGKIMDIIWGYSATDDFSAYHDLNRGTEEDFDFTVVKEEPIVDDDDDITPVDDDDGKDTGDSNTIYLVGGIISIIVLVVAVMIIIFLVTKGKKEDETKEE